MFGASDIDADALLGEDGAHGPGRRQRGQAADEAGLLVHEEQVGGALDVGREGEAQARLVEVQALIGPVLEHMDESPLGRRARGLRALVREKVAYFALAALAAAVALLALRSGWAMTSYGDVGLLGRLALMTYSFTFYLWSWLWPVGLSPMYELPVTVNPFGWRFLLPLAAFPAIAVALYAPDAL